MSFTLKEYLVLVGLEKVINNNATITSGGQQQRTAIARAIFNNPDMILADEPTGNLDSDSTETVYNLLRGINEKIGTTFIIITHDRKLLKKLTESLKLPMAESVLTLESSNYFQLINSINTHIILKINTRLILLIFLY